MEFIRRLFNPDSQSSNHPTHVLIFGNGHLPEQQRASFLYAEWLTKRKATLGNGIDQDVAVQLNEGRYFSDRMMFAEYTKIWIQSEYPAYFSDELMLLDQQSGKDLILYALWSPDVASRVKALLGK